MESNTHSPSPDNTDSKAAFRKPLNDAANRKYRRKSPVNGSSSSDGSPKHERGSSPIDSGEAPARDTDARRKKDDGRDLERDSGRNHHGRGGDSYRHYDRQSNRSSHSYHRRDDYARHDRYTDEEDRHYKSSSRSGRESRVGSMSDYRRRENENYRSRDNLHGDEKYSRDGSGHRSSDKERDHEYGKYKDKDSSSDRAGSGRRHANLNAEGTKSGEWSRHKGDGDGRDEKRDYWRSSGDYKSDRSPVYEATGGHGDDVTSRRDSAGHRWKEASKSDLREVDGQKYAKEERKKYDNRETSRHKDRHDREAGEQFEDGTVFMSENKEESAAKKPKISLGGENVSKFTTVADERQSSKQANELGKVTSEQAPAKGSEAGNDIDAAKVAAMKAAELVNRNLVGTGYMSTDQKKKLLWGNKKNSTSEESGHRWDTALFSDRERQEKFNKLMGVKGDPKVEPKPENQESVQAEKQRELQLDLEKQYTAGLRRRDGRTVGLGL